MRRSSLAFVALLASAVPLSAQDIDTRTGTICVDAHGSPVAAEQCWFDLRAGFGRDGYGEIFSSGTNAALASYSFFLADAEFGWTDLTYESFLVSWDPVTKRPIDVLYHSAPIYGPTSPTYVETTFNANVLLTPGQLYAAMIIGVGVDNGGKCLPAPIGCDGRYVRIGTVKDTPGPTTQRIGFDAFFHPDLTRHDSDILHPEDMYALNDEWDMAFKVNFTDAATVMATPEPSSVLLMGTGLIVLALVYRRRRQTRVADPRMM
jgi:hypothetical protein